MHTDKYIKSLLLIDHIDQRGEFIWQCERVCGRAHREKETTLEEKSWEVEFMISIYIIFKKGINSSICLLDTTH